MASSCSNRGFRPCLIPSSLRISFYEEYMLQMHIIVLDVLLSLQPGNLKWFCVITRTVTFILKFLACDIVVHEKVFFLVHSSQTEEAHSRMYLLLVCFPHHLVPLLFLTHHFLFLFWTMGVGACVCYSALFCPIITNQSP